MLMKSTYLDNLAGVCRAVLLLVSSQMCLVTSAALILLLASFTSNLEMRSLASPEM